MGEFQERICSGSPIERLQSTQHMLQRYVCATDDRGDYENLPSITQEESSMVE